MPDPPQLDTRRYLIRGRVQGVGFRFFVEREAQALGVAGWVRNTPEGAVEVLATATHEQHAVLKAKLRQGPRASRVDEVAESAAAAVPDLDSFRIEGAW